MSRRKNIYENLNDDNEREVDFNSKKSFGVGHVPMNMLRPPTLDTCNSKLTGCALGASTDVRVPIYY